MSSGAEQQDDLERMLSASRELRSRYRAASQEEPSSHIDDAVRAHARRAVGARPRSAASPFGSSWRVPLSIAAVLVLSVTLTVMVARQGQHLPSADRLTQGERAPAVAPAGPQAPEAAKPSADAKESAPERRAKARGTKAPEQQRPLEKDLYQAPAQPPLSDESAARALRKQAEPFPAAPAAPPPPAAHMESAPSSAPEPKAAAPAAAPPEQERDSAAAGRVDTPNQRGLVREPQDAETRSSSANVVDAQAKLKSEESAGGLGLRFPPQKRQAPAAAAEQPQIAPTSTTAPWESDPRAWLQHIEQLVREERMTDARDSFKVFRQRYPSYRLPRAFPLREP